MNIEIIESEDGSHTLFNPDLNETYHSHHGAITESRHVFIKEGLEKTGKENVKILEVGFGTGLNSLLAFEYAEKNGIKLWFESLEPFPLKEEIYSKLNYGKFTGENLQEKFILLHECEWEKAVHLSPLFTLLKRKQRLEDVILEKDFDCIFFDAFAPNKQSEVWDLTNLQKCSSALNPNGILVTYCAQGQFKRNLKQAGFEVESLPGPPGKKEMTRGWRKQTFPPHILQV
jgi:tRNA U34 5-methylaminomethyl-2-thiouridine-forming methyltransferase MnmC